jgi:hypothetical protein
MTNPRSKATAPMPKSGIDPHGLIVGQGDFRYRVDTHWGRLDPQQTPVENCHGFAMDTRGRILMVTDNTKNNVLVYSQNGKLLDAWGTGFPGAHALKIVNENGEDFIYLVDSGWILNRQWDGHSTDNWASPYNKVIAQSGFVAKLTLDGRLIFTIGHPQTIGVYRPDQPFRPTDVAIAPNGDIYITDGYGSDYLLQYDSQGRYIRHWGGADHSDAQLRLHNTHGIEVDLRNPNDPVLMVSSRAENALKIFSLTGDYRSSIKTPGAYIGGPVFHGDHFYAPVCWSHLEGKNADDSGFISIFDKHNKLIANLGGTQPEYINDELQPMHTTWDIFNHCHAVCVDDEQNLYVGQWRAQQSYPFKLIRL